MKNKASIILLSTIVVGILAFWLYPGVNKAGNATYTRVYEDTDNKLTSPSPAPDLEPDTLPISSRAPVKVFKKETLNPNKSVKKITPEMFSRAVQFVEVEKVLAEEIIQDSVKLASIDSTINVQ